MTYHRWSNYCWSSPNKATYHCLGKWNVKQTLSSCNQRVGCRRIIESIVADFFIISSYYL